jgi:DNA-binding CsgD family transcriptional regulator
MEAAETLKPVPKPDLSFNNDPTWFLEGINYLDSEDPIDRLLIDYKEDIATESLPTAAQQRVMIGGLKGDNLESARMLVNTHQGLVAAVAYPFKASEQSTEDLLRTGTRALIQAAKTYDKTDPVDFSDYAALMIHDTLSKVFPELAGDSFIELSQPAMEGVYQFMETVQSGSPVDRVQQMQERIRERERRQVLSCIYLPDKETAELTGLSIHKVKKIIYAARAEVDGVSREELAVIKLREGAEYDILEAPPKEEFTFRERMVATRLSRKNAEIAEELGLTRKQLALAVSSLWEKTGARTRTELVLMARINNFEPAEEEFTFIPLAGMEGFTPDECEVLEYLHLPYKEIAAYTGKTHNVIKHTIGGVFEKTGLRNRTALIVELYERGAKFDITHLERPLVELLNSEEMEIALLAHLPYEEIGERVNLPAGKVSSLMSHARDKLGARSRPELAIMVREFDTGERREKDTRSRKEKFAAKLGLESLEGCNIELLLDHAAPIEHELIAGYYLSEEEASWRALGTRLTLSRSAAYARAHREIRRMKAVLAEAA